MNPARLARRSEVLVDRAGVLRVALVHLLGCALVMGEIGCAHVAAIPRDPACRIALRAFDAGLATEPLPRTCTLVEVEWKRTRRGEARSEHTLDTTVLVHRFESRRHRYEIWTDRGTIVAVDQLEGDVAPYERVFGPGAADSGGTYFDPITEELWYVHGVASLTDSAHRIRLFPPSTPRAYRDVTAGYEREIDNEACEDPDESSAAE